MQGHRLSRRAPAPSTSGYPRGVEDGQRIRLAGQGEAGLRGAPSGGPVRHRARTPQTRCFARDGDDLTVTVPVSFSELGLGYNTFCPDAGRQGRCSGAQGDDRWSDPAGGADAVCPSVSGGQGDLPGHRESRGPAEPGRRCERSAGGLRRCRAVQWFRPGGPDGAGNR